MKTKVFFKAVCAAIIMVAVTTTAKAGNFYATNDVMNGDQVTTRFVYQKDNQTLSYHLKYDFTYDESNRLASKETFRWDKNSEEWVRQSTVQYTYNGSEIFVEADYLKKGEKGGSNYTAHMEQTIQDISSPLVAHRITK